MVKVLFAILMIPIPVLVLVTGVYLSIRRLHTAGLRFNYALLDCLAICISFVPTCGMLVFIFQNATPREMLESVAVGCSLVMAQVLGIVLVRTRILTEKRDGMLTSVSVLVAGLVGLGVGLAYSIISAGLADLAASLLR